MAENLQSTTTSRSEDDLREELYYLTNELAEIDKKLDAIKRNAFRNLILEMSKENDECVNERIKCVVGFFLKGKPFHRLKPNEKEEVSVWVFTPNSYGDICRTHLDEKKTPDSITATDYERYIFTVYSIALNTIFYEEDILSDSQKIEANLFINQELSTEVLNIEPFLGKSFGLDYFREKIEDIKLLKALREELNNVNEPLSEKFNDWIEQNWDKASRIIYCDSTNLPEDDILQAVLYKSEIESLEDEKEKINRRIGSVAERINPGIDTEKRRRLDLKDIQEKGESCKNAGLPEN